MNDDVADVASECSHYTGPHFIGFYREDGSAKFFLYIESVVLKTSIHDTKIYKNMSVFNIK